ncbi:hypothetical protein Pint_21260 [Pistacia integerrima]|uniref:Uncharacterized protein n=1 Tax=Pistacia integerrima TaxID=434235 RepID=A0ACC0XBE9_9ROSI|nr:hypothetical protein Pint_21260 [Pistacia integerrima]
MAEFCGFPPRNPRLFWGFPALQDQVRSDWESVKIDVMYKALKCKFSIYPHLNSMLLSTAGSILVEASPHDLFWGGGHEGEGLNYLGRLLDAVEIRVSR